MVTIEHQENRRVIRDYGAARRVQDALTPSIPRKSLSVTIESIGNNSSPTVQMERLSADHLEKENTHNKYRWNTKSAQNLMCWTLFVVLMVICILASVLVMTALYNVRLPRSARPEVLASVP